MDVRIAMVEAARYLRRAQRRLSAPATRGIAESMRRAPTIVAHNHLFNVVRPHSMLHEEDLIELALETERVLSDEIEGAFVECGTWRGGSSFLMAGILRSRRAPMNRQVWMFDSFEGLPAPGGDDVTSDGAWTPDHPYYQNNLAADFDDVRQAADRLGLARRVRIVKGWFDSTLPAHREEIGSIALLRLDGDLYESTKICLETLYDRVSTGGAVILDDYHYWDGCAVALHEFLGSRRLAHRITTPRGSSGPVIIRVL